MEVVRDGYIKSHTDAVSSASAEESMPICPGSLSFTLGAACGRLGGVVILFFFEPPALLGPEDDAVIRDSDGGSLLDGDASAVVATFTAHGVIEVP